MFKNISVKAALIAMPLLAFSAQASANQTIRCERADAERITIYLRSDKYQGTIINCISGDFIYDMTPCAPKGGFGLSAPTGSASLVDIVWRWQDYGSHLGGVTSYNESSDELVFTGGFVSDGGWSGQWNFKVDRVAGVGVLLQQPEGAASGKLSETGRYKCKAVQAQF
jgi:hypothetical protein